MDSQFHCNLLIPNGFATLFYIQRKMPALPMFQARQMEISLAQKPRSSGHNTLFDRMCPAIKVNFSSCYERKLGFWPQLHRTRLFWLKVKVVWRRGWPPKEHHSKGWRQARGSLNAWRPTCDYWGMWAIPKHFLFLCNTGNTRPFT